MTFNSTMLLIGIHLLLLVPAVYASVYLQPFRVECEPLCQKMQPFSGYCPVYGSCQWYCQEKQAKCPTHTRYHCARHLNAEDTFVAACAQETFCREGEEPRISIYNVSSAANQATASVFCRPCSNKEKFNGRFNTSSATYSECPNVKTNLCTEQAHKLDCGYVSYRELTKTDGYCRCDARNGYAVQSEVMCFYENKHCVQKKCPATEELLLDYSCAKVCQTGFARPPTSDICHPTEINTSEKSTSASKSTQSSSHDYSYIMTTTAEGSTVSGTSVFRKPIEGENTIVFITALISLILISVLVITVYWIIQDKRRCCDGRKKSFQRETDTVTQEEIPLMEITTGAESKYKRTDKDASEALHFEQNHFENIESSKPTRSETVLLKLEDTKTDSHEPLSTRADRTIDKPEHYPGQQTMENVLKQIKEKGGFNWKTCLEIIRNDAEFRKLDGFEMGQKDPYFSKVRKRIDVPGYQAYELPGNDTSSLYELVSVLLCGNTNMQEIIRVAVARSALINYKQNVKKLLDMFTYKKNGVQEATIFFRAHGIDFKETPIKESVPQYYMDLVREIICEGKRRGPFHLELLGAVLNCNIIQHFEDDCFNGQDVHKIPGLNIGLHSKAPNDRELCLCWLRTGDSDQYIIVPLFKHDHVDPSEQYLNTTFQGQCKGVIDKITEQSSFSRTESLSMICNEVSFIFDRLRLARCCKPKEPLNTAIVFGFTAYERPGNEPSCLYEWISYLFCGTDFMTCIIRLHAATYAMENFKKYAKKLCEAFNTSDTPTSDAEIFFKLHGIDYQNSNALKNDVKTALAALVRETVIVGKGNGPLFADFLCGALNYQLTRHFENNRYHGQDVGKIPALNVTLTPMASIGRDVHLLWRESRSDRPETCRILLLIQNEDPNDDLGT